MNPLTVLMPEHSSLTTQLARLCSDAGRDPVIIGKDAVPCVPNQPPPEPRGVNLQALQRRIDAFQITRFPDQSLHSKLNHLVREARELRADPEDIMEWADVLILLLGSAAAAGLDSLDLFNAALIKMTINESRRWGQPDAEGVYHHL